MTYNIVEYGDDITTFMCSLFFHICDNEGEKIVWCGWSNFLNTTNEGYIRRKMGHKSFYEIKKTNQLIIIEREKICKSKTDYNKEYRKTNRDKFIKDYHDNIEEKRKYQRERYKIRKKNKIEDERNK